MALLRPPKLSEIRQSIGPQMREWWKRESTRALRRRLLLIAVVVVLGWFGPTLIASSVFPSRQTAIDSVEAGVRCTYDATSATPIDRRAPPPTPSPVVTGVTTAYNIAIRNTGSCAWDDRVALRREGGSLTDTPIAISTTATIRRNDLLTLQIPFTAPMQMGVFDSNWRLRAPDDRAFGATLSFSIITHREGETPRYPPRLLFTPVQWLAVMAVVVSGACGLAMALSAGGGFIKDFYGLKNDRLGREHLLRLMFNLSKPVSAKAAEGKLEVGAGHEAIDRIGGPGSLTVDGGTNTIVVLERGSRFSRIVGGGTQGLAPFERVRAVIDARQLSRPKSEAAYTKDGIEIKVDTTTSFRLVERIAGEQIPEAPHREPVWNQIKAKLGLKVAASRPPEKLFASPEAIRTIVYDGPAGIDWDKTVSTGIADEIPKKMLDELWAIDDPDRNPRRELIEELRAKTSESLRKRGIELIDFSFGPLNVAQEIVARRRDWWQAYWKKDTRITVAEGDAEALQVHEEARAEAQTRMITAIAQGLRDLESHEAARLSEVIAMRFIDTIESIAGVWLTDENRSDYLSILKELRRLPSSATVADDTQAVATERSRDLFEAVDDKAAQAAYLPLPFRLSVPVLLKWPAPSPKSVRFFRAASGAFGRYSSDSDELNEDSQEQEYVEVDRVWIHGKIYLVRLISPDSDRVSSFRLYKRQHYIPLQIAPDRENPQDTFVLMRSQDHPDRPDQEVVVTSLGREQVWVTQDRAKSDPRILGDSPQRWWLFKDDVGHLRYEEGQVIGVVEVLLVPSVSLPRPNDDVR